MTSHSAVTLTRSGDGDVGAGPPHPAPEAALHVVRHGHGHDGGGREELSSHIRSLDATDDEHERLRERIRSLEESLERLGRESLERAKFGMERLAERYFPDTRGGRPTLESRSKFGMGMSVPAPPAVAGMHAMSPSGLSMPVPLGRTGISSLATACSANNLLITVNCADALSFRAHEADA